MIKIDAAVDGAKILYLTLKGEVKESSESLKKYINNNYEKWLEKSSEQNIQDHASIASFKSALKQFGWNPNKYRISSDALIRRYLKSRQLPEINNIVDINNMLSIVNIVPVGSYDLKQLDGEVTLRLGECDETYNSLKKDNFKISGLTVLSDNKGAFGSPVCDSKRAIVNDSTTDILMVFYSFSDINEKEILNQMSDIAQLTGLEIIKTSFVS